MRDRWIPDSSKFHKPINEDSANEDVLFVCGIFFMGMLKMGSYLWKKPRRDPWEICTRQCAGSGQRRHRRCRSRRHGPTDLIQPRERSAEYLLLTVSMMNGGTQSNIIADEVRLVGTTRAFDVDEDTFPDGSAIYARFAIDCLKKLGKH